MPTSLWKRNNFTIHAVYLPVEIGLDAVGAGMDLRQQAGVVCAGKAFFTSIGRGVLPLV